MATRTVYACERCQPLLQGTDLDPERAKQLAAATPVKVNEGSTGGLVGGAREARGGRERLWRSMVIVWGGVERGKEMMKRSVGER
jgi:hypothetical protein